MMFALGERDFSLKYRCQTQENLSNKAKNMQHTRRSKAWLLGIYLTLLQEKLVVLMLL